MTCQHCNGSVDVVCMNGAAVRCGCGKTLLAYEQPRPAPGADLRALLRLLTEHRVRVYRSSDCQIELDSSAWGQEAPRAEAIPPDKLCACGHALHDHNQTGCVLGCPVDNCGMDP